MDMYSDRANKYFVVKFLDKPYSEFAHLLTATRQMIKEYGCSDEKFLVPYPDDNEDHNNERMLNEAQNTYQPLYFCNIVHGSRTVKDSEKYIKNNDPKEHGHYYGDFLLREEKELSKEDKALRQNTQRADQFYVIKLLELPFSHMKKYCVVPLSWLWIYGPSTNKILVSYPPPNNKTSKIYIQENREDTSSWKLYFAETVFGPTRSLTAYKKLRELYQNQNQQEIEDGNEDNNSNPEKNQEDFFTKYNELSKKFDDNIDKINTMFVNMQETVNDINETKQEMKSLFEEYVRDEVENKSTTSEDKNETPFNDDVTGQSDDEYIEDEPSPRKKMKRQLEKIILPPEYDENDPRWTLKHPEHKEGLVELLEGYQVYVDSQVIEKSNETLKIVSKSNFANVLTKLLLEEVFSTSALAVCSYIVLNPKPSVGDKARPSLDYEAVCVLIEFIKEMGRPKRWFVDVPNIVKTVANNKMRELRKINSNEEH